MGDQVPATLWLVESYLNSVDIESGRDDLDAVPRFARWLAAHRHPVPAGAITPADLALARELRDSLRQLIRDSHDGPAEPPGVLDGLLVRIPLRAAFESGQPVLRPAAAGPVPAVLGEVLAAIVLARADGTWARLKLCRADDCQVVFYDRSRNSSRCWCDMRSCGNRSKARTYRSRHAPAHPVPLAHPASPARAVPRAQPSSSARKTATPPT